MKKKSLANPTSYKEKVKIYYDFKKGQDFPKKIDKLLISKIRNKVVLDLGCGNGESAKTFAPHSKKYFALDISKEQLELAKKTTKGIKKIKFIHSNAEKIPLPKKSVEVIILVYVLSVIQGFRKKKRVLEEIERILKKDGKIFLVENDSGGEFEEIRGHLKRTKNYNDWLKKQGFKEKKINTYFKYSSLKKAKEIFFNIWGIKISKKLKSSIVKQKVIVFEKSL